MFLSSFSHCDFVSGKVEEHSEMDPRLAILVNSSTTDSLSSKADLESVSNPISDTTPTAAAVDSLALSADRFDKFFVGVDVAVERPESRARANLATEDGSLDPPWQDRTHLMSHEGSCWDGKDVIELFL